ncbi:MAG: hypothetical protein ACRD8O_18845 [Bryobacteraceae bacterium]
MHCLLCRQKITLRRRLSGDLFCCDEHRRQHSSEQSDQGLKRLLEQPSPAKLVQMPAVRRPNLDLALAGYAEEVPPEPALGLTGIAGSLRWKNWRWRPLMAPPLAVAGAFVRPSSLTVDVAVANCFGTITWGMANRCIWPPKSLQFPSHPAALRSGLHMVETPVESTLEPLPAATGGAEAALEEAAGDWFEIAAARPRFSLRRPAIERPPLEVSPVIPTLEPQLGGFLNGYFNAPTRPDFAAWASSTTEPGFTLPGAILALRAKDPDLAPVKDWQDAIKEAIPLQPVALSTDCEVWEAHEEPLCEAPSPWGGSTPGTALIACAVGSAPWLLTVPDGIPIASAFLEEALSPRMTRVAGGVFSASSAASPRAVSPEIAAARFEPVALVPKPIDPGSPRSIIEGTGVGFTGLAEGNGGTAVRMADDRSKGSRPADDSVMQLLAPRRRSVVSRLFGWLKFAGASRRSYSSRRPRRRWGLVTATALAAAIPLGFFAMSSGSGGFKLESLQAAISSRAMVEFEDDFRNGLGAWEGEGAATSSWTFDHTGFAIPGRLALHQASTSLADYRVEFLAMIDKKALGMVYRAADVRNYYAMRINIVEAGPLPKAKIERYAVIDGKIDGRSELPLSLPLRSEMMYRVRVNVAGDRFTVSVNGQVVDTWSDSRLPKGGVGFFGGKGEVARLRWVRIVDQDDFLGKVCARLSPRADDWKTRSEHALRRTLARSKSEVVGTDR